LITIGLIIAISIILSLLKTRGADTTDGK